MYLKFAQRVGLSVLTITSGYVGCGCVSELGVLDSSHVFLLKTPCVHLTYVSFICHLYPDQAGQKKLTFLKRWVLLCGCPQGRDLGICWCLAPRDRLRGRPQDQDSAGPGGAPASCLEPVLCAFLPGRAAARHIIMSS